MKKYRLLAISIVLVSLAALLIWNKPVGNEPSYEGKTLSQWLISMRMHSPDNEKEKEAVRQIGKSAVPTLVRLLESADSPTKLKVQALLSRLHLFSFPAPVDHQNRHYMAAAGFDALGPDAESAVPELIKLTNNKDSEIRSIAVTALGNIGPAAKPAIPALIKRLGDEYEVCGFAAVALANIGEQPDMVIPALVNALHTNQNFAWPESGTVIDAIGSFSNKSTNVIPTLQKLLKNTSDGNLRLKIENTLSEISSSAPAKEVK